MKPIFVIIAPRLSYGQQFAMENKLSDDYDWRVVTSDSHLLGYRHVTYWDMGGSPIGQFALEHFKAFNDRWVRV